jgi:hypothetical protein
MMPNFLESILTSTEFKTSCTFLPVDLERLDAYPFHYVIQHPLHNNTPLVWIPGLNKENLLRFTFPSFQEKLNSFSPKSFTELLHLLAVHMHLPETDWAQSSINPPFRPHAFSSILDERLKETNGYILYKHQLESLLQITIGYRTPAAELFRKNWNKKHNETRLSIQNMYINESMNLETMLENRFLDTTNQFVFEPSFHEAFNIWKIVQQTG